MNDVFPGKGEDRQRRENAAGFPPVIEAVEKREQRQSENGEKDGRQAAPEKKLAVSLIRMDEKRREPELERSVSPETRHARERARTAGSFVIEDGFGDADV